MGADHNAAAREIAREVLKEVDCWLYRGGEDHVRDAVAEALDRARQDGVTEGREMVARWMLARSYATGHGDTIEDLLGELVLDARQEGHRAGLEEAAAWLDKRTAPLVFAFEAAEAIRALATGKE